MFTLAILIGIYSYAIFSLGLLSILNIISVSVVSLLFILISYFYYFRKRHIRTPNLKILIKNKVLSLLIFIIISQVIVNLVGVLGPELGFDALWYHLTLPKLYVLNHSIFHIPGGLMYYSDMPKLTEMFYTAGLFFGDERIPKLIHFGFGILTCIAIYRISGKFMNNFLSVLSVVVFYSSLVVGWQSTSAYVDLSRTFFEIMALWGFLNFIETKDRKWFIKSALMIGLAISTKLLAIGSLFIFTIFICYFLIKFKRKATNIIINVLAYWSIELLIPFPWFIFSFIHTGNPVYPFFS
ncbi:MAG: glycosyltransferase family 39 protein, partial [Patescibacteria group bacterium]